MVFPSNFSFSLYFCFSLSFMWIAKWYSCFRHMNYYIICYAILSYMSHEVYTIVYLLFVQLCEKFFEIIHLLLKCGNNLGTNKMVYSCRYSTHIQFEMCEMFFFFFSFFVTHWCKYYTYNTHTLSTHRMDAYIQSSECKYKRKKKKKWSIDIKERKEGTNDNK